MKKIQYIVILTVMALIGFGCDGEDTPDVSTDEGREAIIESLQGSWSTSEVRKENTVISDFANFSLTIDGKSYSTQNGTPVWPSSGTFDFETAETENEFLRQDGRLFTASVNNGRLTIIIVYQEETARGEFGTYEFVME